MASASRFLMASNRLARVLSSATLPSVSLYSAFASSTVLSSLDVSTAFTSLFRDFPCVQYHAVFAVMAFVAVTTASLESALQDTVFGVDAFMALPSASRVFASFTLFMSVFTTLAARPFNSALYAVVATWRRSLSAAQSALASAMRRSVWVFHTMPPAASSAMTATAIMATARPRCGFFVFSSIGSDESSTVSSFSVICPPCFLASQLIESAEPSASRIMMRSIIPLHSSPGTFRGRNRPPPGCACRARRRRS